MFFAISVLWSRIRSLPRSRRGSVFALFGLSMIPLTVATGMGIDAARAYAVKVRLGAALDAAALAVGSSDPAAFTKAQLETRMKNYFDANYHAAAIGTPATPVMSYAPNSTQVINFTAQAAVPTTFMRLIGVNSLKVSVANQVTRGISGLEVALVLDNTGSMLCGDGGNANCNSGVPPSHITSLREDAKDIIDTLFANSVDPSKLKIALVPYVTTVNVGPAMSQSNVLNTYVPKPYKDVKGNAIKDFNNNAITYNTTQTENTPQWRGCVIEPTAANEDTTGIGPDITEPVGGWTAPWVPFYWRPNTNANGTNDWNLTTKPIQYLHTDGNVLSAWTNSRGPNNGCPTPLVRLTSNKSTLTTAVAGLKSWAAGGTQIHIGMIWAWRVLSPNPPFGDGQPYGTPGWVKAVVLETDGQNELPDSHHLTGLSFLADGKFGSTNQATALNNVNGRLAKVCANMKAAGIVIYTVGLGIGATGATAPTLQACASDPSKFFPAPDAAALSAAFKAIATSLNNLYLSK
jgi:Flp pilus assembly protein TadG